MPTLIQNHNKKIITTRLKKFYSTINQAILLSEQDKNIMRVDWNPTSFCSPAEAAHYSCNVKFFNEYLKDYIKYTKIEKKYDRLYVYFADGSVVMFGYYGMDMKFYPKASKVSLPLSSQVAGKDFFYFAFYPDGASGNRNKYFKNLGVEPYIDSDWDGTKEGLYNSCVNATKIIQLNGWQIPDDYPCFK